jgi:alpha-galactosidase
VVRIVLAGAGSVESTRDLLGDFLSYPELADATIVLHDIAQRYFVRGIAVSGLKG